MEHRCVRQFINRPVKKFGDSLVQPESALLEKFLNVISQLGTSPYIKGEHQVNYSINDNPMRVDLNERVFQAALLEMYQAKITVQRPMEVIISPIPNTFTVTLGLGPS